MSNTTPPPLPAYPPQPEPPKKSRTNLVIIGSAVAVIAAIVATGLVVVNSRDDSSAKKDTSTTADATTDDVVATDEEPADDPEPTETGTQVFGLNDTVTYENDVEVSLSKFARGTTGQYGEPENAPYVKFAVRVKNGGTSTIDTSQFTANCSYGEDGQTAESVFDSDQGLDGGPSTRLLAGRSITVMWACALPKSEKTIQIEVAPDFETEAAIFTGDVK